MFLPFEQETSRTLASRLAVGLGSGPIVRRAGVLGGGLVLLLVIGCLIVAPQLTDRLFRGDVVLFVGLLIGIPAYCVANLVEGTLSGNGRFARYGLYLGSEATFRLGICVLCVVIGVKTAGPYGLALGVAPFLALVPALWRERGLVEPGPEVSWHDLTLALGALLAGSVMAQVLINAGPLLVQLLATPDEKRAAGVFTAALVMARVPLFLFQAVQATLLPKLSGLAASGRFDDFRRGMRTLLGLIAVLVAVGVGVAFAAGPFLVRLIFGPGFVVTRTTIGLLTLASGLYVLAISLAQALIALGGARRVAVGWTLGVVALAITVPFFQDLLLRVELAFLAGTATAALFMGWELWRAVRRGDVMHTGDAIEALHDLPLEP